MTERLLLQQNILLTKLINGVLGSTKGIREGASKLQKVTKKPLFDESILKNLPTMANTIAAAFEKFPTEFKATMAEKATEGGDILPPLSPLEVGIQQGVEAIVKSIMVVASLLKESFSGVLSSGERAEFRQLTDSILVYQEQMKEEMTGYHEQVGEAIAQSIGDMFESPEQESERLYAEREKKSKAVLAGIPAPTDMPRTLKGVVGQDTELESLFAKYSGFGADETFVQKKEKPSKLQSMWGEMGNIGKAFKDKVFKPVLKPLKKMGGSLKANIGSMGIQADLMQAVLSPISAFVSGVLAPFSILAEVMGGLGEKLGMVFVPLIIKISEMMMSLMPLIDFLVQLFTPLINVIITLLDQLQPLIDMMMVMIMESLQPIMDLIMAFMPIFTALIPFIVMLFGFMMQFQSIFSKIISSILPILTTAITTLLVPLMSLMDLFQGNISVLEFGKVVLDSIGQMFVQIGDALWTWIKNIPALIGDWIKDMFSPKEWF